jgi:hypothetical protein
MHRRLHLILFAAVAALLLAAPGASAKTKVYKGEIRAGGTYVFDFGDLKVRRIKRVILRASGQRTRIKARNVRGAIRNGKLKVAPLRIVGLAVSAASSRPRLVVKLRPPRRRPGQPGSSGGNVPIPTGDCGANEVYGPGNWPGACWRPYSDSSPFNRRIPSGAPNAPHSDAIVDRLTGFGEPDSLASHRTGADDWYHPIYFSKPSDPEFTIHCAADWGTCEGEGEKVRIPDEARAAAEGDGHLTVIDQQSGWEYDFWQVKQKPRGGGRLVVSWGGKTRIDGDGLGSAAVAAHYGAAAGIIRAPELAAGRINHALFMVVRCTDGKNVYPAQGQASICSQIGRSNENAPKLGHRFQLQMSDAEINALNVPEWKKTVLRAMAEYGMYVGDTGGNAWGIQFESSQTYLSFGHPDPFVRIGEQNGLPEWQGDRVFHLRDGVNWKRQLRVVDSCTADGSC